MQERDDAIGTLPNAHSLIHQIVDLYKKKVIPKFAS